MDRSEGGVPFTDRGESATPGARGGYFHLGRRHLELATARGGARSCNTSSITSRTTTSNTSCSSKGTNAAAAADRPTSDRSSSRSASSSARTAAAAARGTRWSPACSTLAGQHRAKPLGLSFPRGWGDFLRQLAIWFGFAAAYQVARGLADPGASEAVANARRVIHAEERLGSPVRARSPAAGRRDGGLASPRRQLDVLALAVHGGRARAPLDLPPPLPGLSASAEHDHRRERGRPRRLVAMPTAPPRLLPEFGFTDTLAQSEWLNHGTGLVVLASNPHAAMPSLHTADVLIIGFALASVQAARSRRSFCSGPPGSPSR